MKEEKKHLDSKILFNMDYTINYWSNAKMEISHQESLIAIMVALCRQLKTSFDPTLAEHCSQPVYRPCPVVVMVVTVVFVVT